MVIARQSEQLFEQYFELAGQIGVQEVRFIPLRQIGGGIACSDDVPDLYGCFVRLLDILRRRPEFARLLQRDFFSILMAACRFSRLRDNCGIARRCLFVDADGSIFPCPNHRALSHRCGHVLTTPLATILENSPVLRGLRRVPVIAIDALPPVCLPVLVRWGLSGGGNVGVRRTRCPVTLL